MDLKPGTKVRVNDDVDIYGGLVGEVEHRNNTGAYRLLFTQPAFRQPDRDYLFEGDFTVLDEQPGTFDIERIDAETHFTVQFPAANYDGPDLQMEYLVKAKEQIEKLGLNDFDELFATGVQFEAHKPVVSVVTERHIYIPSEMPTPEQKLDIIRVMLDSPMHPDDVMAEIRKMVES